MRERNRNIVYYFPIEQAILMGVMGIGACYAVFKILPKFLFSQDSEQKTVTPKIEVPSKIIVREERGPVIYEGPKNLQEFVGQKLIKKYIKFHLDYCKREDKPFPHVIFYGHGGLGKSSLCKVIAHEMGVPFQEVTPAIIGSSELMMGVFFWKICPTCGTRSSYSLKRCPFCRTDISLIFDVETKVKEKEIIFLEECHSLSKNIEEALYSVMQDFYMVVRVGGTIIEKELPPLTIAGATTKLGMLNDPFLQRFNLKIKIEPYSETDLLNIIKSFCDKQSIYVQENVQEAISKISHGTPRIAKNLIKDLRAMSLCAEMKDFTELKKMKQLDDLGLDETQRRIIKYLLIRKRGGAGAIATYAGLTQGEYEQVHEPILVFHDLIMQTSSGRVLTDNAINLYGKLLI